MSTQNKYRRVPQEKEKIAENEIRITSNGNPGNFIRNSFELLNELNLDSIVLKATGQAIAKCCKVADILHQRVVGLAMITRITHIKLSEVYEPKEEGLDKVEITRTLTVLEIELKKKPTEEDKKQPGFQEGLSKEEVEKADIEREKRREVMGDRSRGPPRRGGRSGGYGGGYGGYGGYNRPRSHSNREEEYYEEERPRRTRGGGRPQRREDYEEEEEEYRPRRAPRRRDYEEEEQEEERERPRRGRGRGPPRREEGGIRTERVYTKKTEETKE